jgi:hypothetical protein
MAVADAADAATLRRRQEVGHQVQDSHGAEGVQLLGQGDGGATLRDGL